MTKSVKLAIAILGIIQLARGRTSTSLTDKLFSGTAENVSSYALALYSGKLTLSKSMVVSNQLTGLWAFDGWDQTNYVAGEMKNPERNIPRVIHSSMAIVIVSDSHLSSNHLTRTYTDAFPVGKFVLFRLTRQSGQSIFFVWPTCLITVERR